MGKTKIDLISGFLGAGKTTFLKKLVQDVYPEEKVVILENEFGRINIDQETLNREGLIVKPIQAGCICCSSSMDLSKGIQEIMQEYAPDRIVIEPTGIARLSELKKLLQSEVISKLCVTEHIITIVDAKNYYTRTMISKDFFEDQIRSSKVIFLSKTQDLEKEWLLEVKEAILQIQPDCTVIIEPWDTISGEHLRTIIGFKQTEKSMQGKLMIDDIGNHPIKFRKNHVNDFDRHEFLLEGTIGKAQMNQFIQSIQDGRYGEVHRLKGICRDPEGGSYSVDYVPGETVMNELQSEKKEPEQSSVCLIGRNIEHDRLEEGFRFCIR